MTAQARPDSVPRGSIDNVYVAVSLSYSQQRTIWTHCDGERVAGRNGTAKHDRIAASQELPCGDHGGAGFVSRRSGLNTLRCLCCQGKGQERIVMHQAFGRCTKRSSESLARLDRCCHRALLIARGLAKRQKCRYGSAGCAQGEKGKNRDRQATNAPRPPLLFCGDSFRFRLGLRRHIKKGALEHAELTRILGRPVER